MRLLRPNCAVPSIGFFVLAAGAALADDSYVQHNLVSDVPGMADRTDNRVVNAWGMDYPPTGPWWVNLNGTGLSIVWDANGNPYPPANPIVVTVPLPPGQSGHSAPTGIVFNGSP